MLSLVLYMTKENISIFYIEIANWYLEQQRKHICSNGGKHPEFHMKMRPSSLSESEVCRKKLVLTRYLLICGFIMHLDSPFTG